MAVAFCPLPEPRAGSTTNFSLQPLHNTQEGENRRQEQVCVHLPSRTRASQPASRRFDGGQEFPVRRRAARSSRRLQHRSSPRS